MSEYDPKSQEIAKQFQYAEYLEQMKLKFARSQYKRGSEQKSTIELEEDLKTLTKKVKTLEIKVTSHDSMINELEFRTNLIPFADNIDDILRYLQKELSDIDYIQSVSYAPLDEGSIQIIIIHKSEDRVLALQSIRKKVLNVRKAFPDIQFEPVLLHISEVQPDHVAGTKQILQN